MLVAKIKIEKPLKYQRRLGLGPFISRVVGNIYVSITIKPNIIAKYS